MGMIPIDDRRRPPATFCFLAQSKLSTAALTLCEQHIFPGMSDYGSDNDEVDALVAFGQALVEAILEHQPLALVRKMVEDGAPLWFQDHEGTSALHAAAFTENEELIQYLIEQGAVWNAGECW